MYSQSSDEQRPDEEVGEARVEDIPEIRIEGKPLSYEQASGAREGLDFSEPEAVADAPVFRPDGEVTDAARAELERPARPVSPSGQQTPAPAPAPVSAAPAVEATTAVLPTPARVAPAPGERPVALRGAPSLAMGDRRYDGLPSAEDLMAEPPQPVRYPVPPRRQGEMPTWDDETPPPAGNPPASQRNVALPVAVVALILAVVALLFAAGIIHVGTTSVAPNSIGHAQIKPGSLTSADFAAGSAPVGPPGPAGPAGKAGATGPAGVVGARGPAGQLASVTYVSSAAVSKGANQTATATCPAKLKAVGGGASTSGSGGVITSSNLAGTTWQAAATLLPAAAATPTSSPTSVTYTLTATVICAPVGATGH